jgi:ubiquinone/menaquinone biosynthesis C-methylase UbiE
MENIFSSPFLYNLKCRLCSSLNPWPTLNIETYLKEHKVLNVGCGHKNDFFDETWPSTLVGFDISQAFISHISRESPGSYYIGSADQIPFPDHYFDTSLIFFVMHHLPFDMEKAMQEVKRVTRHHVIIYDHKLNNQIVKSMVQRIYWTIFDSGKKYNTTKEWHSLFEDFEIVEERYTGGLFENISQFVLKIKTSQHE